LPPLVQSLRKYHGFIRLLIHVHVRRAAHRLAAIAYQNKAIVHDLLFKTSSRTMRTIAADPKRLGVKIGFTSVLDTCGSAMSHHHTST
jgi:hypothetical protein